MARPGGLAGLISLQSGLDSPARSQLTKAEPFPFVTITPAIFDESAEAILARKAFVKRLATVADEGITNTINQLGRDSSALGVFDPGVADWLEHEKGTAYWRNEVNNGTVKALHGSLAEGMAAGETRRQLRKRVQETFSPLTGGGPVPAWRADRIALVETGGAYEHGGHLVGEEIEDAGFRIEKYWQATGDQLTRDPHRIAGSRNGWIANTRRFALPAGAGLGSASAMYPADPSITGDRGHIMGCRCTAVRREAKKKS